MEEEQLFLPLKDLDLQLFLGRGENRKKLVAEWQRLTGKKDNEFDILCAEFTAHEYQLLFNTDQVTVVPREAKRTKKRLLNQMEQTLLAHLEKEQLQTLKKELGILSAFSLEIRITKIARYILRIRKQ
ncbi:MAG: hypothetical protein AAF518_06535 [Spirochaetota bacterium]